MRDGWYRTRSLWVAFVASLVMVLACMPGAAYADAGNQGGATFVQASTKKASAKRNKVQRKRRVAKEFIRTWYDDWDFDGEMILNGTDRWERCKPYISQQSKLYNDLYESLQGTSSTNGGFGEYEYGDFDAALSPVGVPTAKRVGKSTFRVSIDYVGTQNDLDQAGYDRVLEYMWTATWDVKVNKNYKVVSLKRVSD